MWTAVSMAKWHKKFNNAWIASNVYNEINQDLCMGIGVSIGYGHIPTFLYKKKKLFFLATGEIFPSLSFIQYMKITAISIFQNEKPTMKRKTKCY